MPVLTGDTEYFPEIGPIPYEGPDSDTPLAFKHYDADRVVAGRRMEDHFRFAVAYWHAFRQTGGDPFGPGTVSFPWDRAATAEQRARDRMDAAFEFITKLGVPYYCFHDLDLVDEGETRAETRARLRDVVAYAKEKQAASGVRLLWGTANLFSHPRYMNGAATNPDADVVAFAASQLKDAIDATIALGGRGYVFWGGREGYTSLLHTDMKRETGHLARFLTMARDYARANGFEGVFLIEPKPMEPTKHQYDYDAATVIGFLERHGLADDFKLNLETNHATLAGHTMAHEMQVAADAGMLGSLDANRGDPHNGWDTDQFPTDLTETVWMMLVLLRAGGLQGGGINFDAKVRRTSTDLADRFHAHIGGMDTFARALVIADDLLRSSGLEAMRAERYASFGAGHGAAFEAGDLTLEALAEIGDRLGEPARTSGRQERYENLILQYLR